MRINFVEALDLITNELKKRFERKDRIHIYGLHGQSFNHFRRPESKDADDFDMTKLSVQLTLLPRLTPGVIDRNALSITIKIVSSEELVKRLFFEVSFE